MSVDRLVHWYLVAILVAFPVFGWGSQSAPKRKNPKDLVRDAEIDEQNGRWEPALEKLKDAADQKPKDQKIAEAFKQAKEHLADQSATQAAASCNSMKLDV